VSRDEVLAWAASQLGASGIARAERIQSLWSGYGELFRVLLADRTRFVVKWVRPPPGPPTVSSVRKRRSYDVELAFYRTLASRCDETCRVPRLLASRGSAREGEWVLVLEDLDAGGYPRRVEEAAERDLVAALSWLASFHARFLGERPAGLWSIGTYWHLETRRDELANIADESLRGVAEQLAKRLAAARFTTILHGDPKEANFCFAPSSASVAAVDFQYTGPGAGIIDVAYLLYGRTDEPRDGIDTGRLDIYFERLRRCVESREGARSFDSADLDALEHEWRELYPVARLDFRRFLAGWRPR
jgi:hypothetical protein